jgi:hypothetical protein
MVLSNEEFRIHPNGQILIPEQDYFIWEAHGFKCLNCSNWASCLHEIPPKSLNPKWRAQPESRYPVCNDCHDKFHRLHWKIVKTILDTKRAENHPEALKRIKNGRQN